MFMKACSWSNKNLVISTQRNEKYKLNHVAITRVFIIWGILRCTILPYRSIFIINLNNLKNFSHQFGSVLPLTPDPPVIYLEEWVRWKTHKITIWRVLNTKILTVRTLPALGTRLRTHPWRNGVGSISNDRAVRRSWVRDGACVCSSTCNGS
jgi:hypothetical protein